MRKRPSRPKLTSAHAIAAIALFFALAGGAWAATTIPSQSVGNSQLKANAVTGSKVKDGSLKAKDFAAGQLPAGPQGAQGEPGAKGDTGARGTAGAKGEAGTDGADGAKGNRGPSGLQGDQGETGNRGTRGEAGPLGDTGPQGNRGPTGPAGTDGVDGDTGPRGDQGPRGGIGPEGDPGPQGKTGKQGEEGEPGEPGESGVTTTLVRYGPKVTANRTATSYAACRKGEIVTGGGYEILSSTAKNRFPYVMRLDRPSLVEQPTAEELEEREREAEEEETGFEDLNYPAPPEETAASGWAVGVESVEAGVAFRAYVECAAAPTRGKVILAPARG